MAQCLMLPAALEQQLLQADKILEGRVAGQSTFVGQDGSIYTKNHIEVYRVFKGSVGFDEEIITEGGIYGDLMQVVTPSVQLHVGDYGVLALKADQERSFSSVATTFYSVDERSGAVYGLKETSTREGFYELIARSTGSETIELRRIPMDLLTSDSSAERAAPQLNSVYPLEVTAGTQTVLTITGQGFGTEQGSGHVAFRNADDGGQSFVALQPGPHYLSWSDTEIQIYVPSATLYNNVVAGTGEIQVRSDNGQTVTSAQQVTVDYAKSEVVYNQNLNSTMLVAMQNGGYEFSINQQLNSLLGGSEMVRRSLEKWACNTGVNYKLGESVVPIAGWAHDDVNVFGLSNPGQLPSYLLGKTITTFSGCGTPNGIQWNLIEVDILLNADINWWTGSGQPTSDHFDMETSILHELGHAHLLQHNNNEASPMYFQLTSGAMRRDLHVQTDIEGGGFVAQQSASAQTCGDEPHQLYDFSMCNLSLINGLEEQEETHLNVYPNPFQNEFTISRDWDGQANYVVFDALGRTILSGMLTATQTVISTSDFSSGVYLLEVRNGSDHYTQRLIKN
ncbi:MAG: T9SS type A sorting domain-containing protein [Flavobacteriales bacterium]|nr:T9SS type A sorting domain-containing protein [Flavobacteriales bacterium]